MKQTSKLALLAAATMIAGPAFASKSRVEALSNAKTVAFDVVDLAEKPGRINALPDQVNFEFGGSKLAYSATGAGTGSNPNAEGGIIRSFGAHKLGAYIGRQSSNFNYIAAGSVNADGTPRLGAHFTADTQQYLDNPLTLTYGSKMGDLAWGASLYYANSTRKTANAAGNNFSKSAQGLTFSIGDDVWEAYVVLSLGAQVKDDSTAGATQGNVAKGNSAMKLGGQYSFGSTLAFLDYSSLAAQYAQGAAGTVTSKLGVTSYALGVESMVKGEGTHFFYGVKYVAASEAQTSENSALNGVKVETASLPLTFGIEADAASWLVLRGSISQPVLLGNTTVKTAAASNTDSMIDNATVKFGSSLKFNKFSVDMLMAAGTNGQLNANNFGTSAALNYMF